MLQEKLLQRFLRYVAVPSQSDAPVQTVPSSEGQRNLAELLKQDLAELGLVDLEISEYSVLRQTARTSAGRLHQRSARRWLVRAP